jgi:transcriptional regulator with XRE-family HTH domain
MNRLAVLRRQRRLTQQELAKQVGRNQGWISMLERQRTHEADIKPHIRERLETIFGEPLSDLLRPAC